MGLRLNTNAAAVGALRHLGISNNAHNNSVEHLASGLRIVRSADDPAGLVISEQLRAQIRSLSQAAENTEFASNLVATADAALTEVSALLVGIRESAIFALNTGGTSSEQVAAEQDGVDAAIESINRIAATTRYGNNSLLNGTSGFNVTSQSSSITELSLRSLSFAGASTTQIDINVAAAAERATITAQIDPTGTTAVGQQVIEITGAHGTERLILASGTTTQDMIGMINNVRDNTGISAALSSGTLGTVAATNAIELSSLEFGTTQSISLKVISGADIFAAADAGSTPAAIASGAEVNDSGTNASVSIAGYGVDVIGNKVSVTASGLNGEFTLADGTGPTGSTPLSVVVASSGLNFQLNTEAHETDSANIGFDNLAAFALGTVERTLGGTGAGTGVAAQTIGGFLNSVVAGGANDLSSNPGNALRIIDGAIDQVTGLRGFLGAFEAQELTANVNALSLAFENITKSNSSIRDLDFAAETAQFTRSQILVTAGVSVLASAEHAADPVLNLLGG